MEFDTASEDLAIIAIMITLWAGVTPAVPMAEWAIVREDSWQFA
jgi:hypothetical protein